MCLKLASNVACLLSISARLIDVCFCT